MVTDPERRETDDVAPLEWRRYFDDSPDRTALSSAYLVAVLSALVFSGAIVYSSHPSFAIAWVGGGAAVAGVALFLAGVSGALPPRRNRVTVKDGITYVRDGANRPMLGGFFTTWLGIITVGVGVILMDRLGAVQLSDDRRYPAFVLAVGAMILVFLWFVAFVRIGKRLEFPPPRGSSAGSTPPRS